MFQIPRFWVFSSLPSIVLGAPSLERRVPNVNQGL